MKLIKPSFEIIIPADWRMWGIENHIEKCGRTCYKTEDKITENSAHTFVNAMIRRQHYAMIEHGTLYLEYHIKDVSLVLSKEYRKQKDIFQLLVTKYDKNPYSIVRVNSDNTSCFITTNLRVLIENNWLDDIQFLVQPSISHAKRITVKFICNRQVSHEFSRHRVFSFAQESTRYCNYTKDKFGNELTFIEPCWCYNKDIDYDKDDEIKYKIFENVEKAYFDLINKYNWKPQQAANILPNAIKTELVMTGFIKDWLHFFDLRAHENTGPAHPQAKELAYSLYEEFVKCGYIKPKNV